MPKAQSFAVIDGKFAEIGSVKDILKNYKSSNILSAEGNTILPGLIDGHCHFYSLGAEMQYVELNHLRSFDEVIDKLSHVKLKNKSAFLIGKGWDQNDWENIQFPTKSKLDQLFPLTPVVLKRIDGRAILVNQLVLDMAKIDQDTKIEGGEVVKVNGKLTGVLIDNAVELVNEIIPEPDIKSKIKALKMAEEFCLSKGLTTLTDAGMKPSMIRLIDSLQQINELKIKVYAMVIANHQNINQFLNKGIYKTDRLHVKSFKIYADGALGSRGAVLKSPYRDRIDHYGIMVTPPDTIEAIAKKLANADFQLNTHAIGDSANSFVLKTYASALKSQTNRRWRIEHAQVVDTADFEYFTEIIPSVQPSHSTSDMHWAEIRLGPHRMKGAYAYKKLLDINGRIVLGTDFPVEQVNPMLTFYAAVGRQDLHGLPENGFRSEQGLSRWETLKGMTLWPAYANFEEDEKGSIEIGKFADFVVLNNDIMKIPIEEVPNTKINGTYINGEKVY